MDCLGYLSSLPSSPHLRVTFVSPGLDVMVHSLGPSTGSLILLAWVHPLSLVWIEASVVSSTWKGPSHYGVKDCPFHVLTNNHTRRRMLWILKSNGVV